MVDLFSETAPTMPKSLINASHGFTEFWKAWPSGPRKVAKQQCVDKWARFGCCDYASHIVAHVEWMKTQDDWLRGFICAPLVYLNQQRWVDWEPPIIHNKPTALDKIKADDKLATKPNAEIRNRIKQLTGKSCAAK